MARVTIEDCLEKVPNRFALVHMAAKRVRQFYRGAPCLVKADNKEVVMALREIAQGKILPSRPLLALPMLEYGGRGGKSGRTPSPPPLPPED